MNCAYCTATDVVLYLIPAEDNVIWSCLDCARSQDMYCNKHDLIHTAFSVKSADGSGTHACLLCIENMVKGSGTLAVAYDERIRRSLEIDKLSELNEWVDTVSEILCDDDKPLILLRAIATSAAVRGITLDEVVEEVENTRDIDSLLPSNYFM